MKRIFIGFLTLTLLMSTLLTGCSNEAKKENSTTEQTTKTEGTKESQRAAIVLGVGGLGDQSYNDLAYQGMKDAESKLGVEFDYAEPKAMADFEVHLREMASEGQYVVIVCVGYEQVDALAIVAEEYPDQKFAILDG
ncbi:MAG: hypothetical protein K0S01_4120, partial [Herbinix sp.]|nr:hypothetical protein [Herbinix sp.]